MDNRDSPFEIGSIAKVFTATWLADLVRHHVIELDDPISGDVLFPLKEPEKNGKPVEKRCPVLPGFYRIFNIFFVEIKARGPLWNLRASNLQI